ncbi:hypothetical protein GCM10010129_78460 [Streptomyces fumigatiscleroticus]|nr:hypothetical protein GCM10010129_78460 [Streptomyces fumigatiscleroticus]
MAARSRKSGSDERLEVVTIPVSDVGRAKEFYARLGWRLDRTPPGKVQFTPPGSACSVQFGVGLTTAAPGSAQNTYLCVPDIVAARERLAGLGVDVGEYYHTGGAAPEPGLHPTRDSYRSHFPFRDPDGNIWLAQEVTTRLPGRVGPGAVTFTSAEDLAGALRRAAAAHGGHMADTDGTDQDWAARYARYMVHERTGAPAVRRVGPRRLTLTPHLAMPRIQVMGLLRWVTHTHERLLTRITDRDAVRNSRPPTATQEFAARRPVVLALCASTPIGIIMVLAARPRIGTASGLLFVLANWTLVACVFALAAYAERARRRRLRRAVAAGAGSRAVGREDPGPDLLDG